jgi:hypothetical protein
MIRELGLNSLNGIASNLSRQVKQFFGLGGKRAELIAPMASLQP